MIKAVLLDLDNTLLHNPDTTFAGAFLTVADEYFNANLGFRDFVPTIMKVITQLGQPTGDLSTTNYTFTMDILAHASGQDVAVIEQALADFYKNVYPRLRNCVEPVDGAAELIDCLLDQGYTLAIATNPLYPATAVYQRLEWAGVDQYINDFALITHAENMHSAKPDPAYYAEIVARIGIEPDEALMVGDSTKNDVESATTMGLPTYHIRSGGQDSLNAGTLLNFLERTALNGWSEELAPPPLSPAMIGPELRGNVGALYGMISNVQPHFWNQHPDPNEWSISQILCHLTDSEIQVQRPRLKRILNEDNPFLVQPPAPLGARDMSCYADGLHYAEAYKQARLETLAFLSTLTDDDWHRTARHSIFGLTTLLEMAHFTAQHDRLHINQLCQTLGRCQ